MSDQVGAADIVVAVDGSAHADRAVRWAAEQASLEHRRLVVVAAGRDTEPVAKEALALAQRLQPGVAGHAMSIAGDPRDVLIDLSGRARLLVVGSRGRGAVRTILLGSVSAAVSAYAACPVVVCRPPSDRTSRRGVMVGADGTPESAPVLEFAFEQASLRGLPLTVLHCYWDAGVVAAELKAALGGVGTPLADTTGPEDLRLLLAESVAGFAERFPDVPVTTDVRHGLADEALVPRTDSWDLIVVGRHPMTSVPRALVGSISLAVVERARCTVAVVPVA